MGWVTWKPSRHIRGGDGRAGRRRPEYPFYTVGAPLLYPMRDHTFLCIPQHFLANSWSLPNYLPTLANWHNVYLIDITFASLMAFSVNWLHFRLKIRIIPSSWLMAHCQAGPAPVARMSDRPGPGTVPGALLRAPRAGSALLGHEPWAKSQEPKIIPIINRQFQ